MIFSVIFFSLGSKVIFVTHPFCVLGLFYVGQFFVVVVAWYTSNYLSPTIYVFSEKWHNQYD